MANRTVIQPDTIKPPLLVCQGKLDVILDPNTQLGWDNYLKEGETPNGVAVRQRFWQCPEGRHFFLARTSSTYFRSLGDRHPMSCHSSLQYILFNRFQA